MATKQKQVRLSEVAMLVHLRLNTWSARVKDKTVSGEVCNQKGSEENAGDWFTNVVSRSAIQPIKTARSRCRALHYALTLPYLDGGMRILPSARFMEYRDEMKSVLSDLEDAVSDFITNQWPTIVKDAPTRLGNLYTGATFPTGSEIKQRFAARFEIFPVPENEDFRVKMGSKERKQVEDQVRESIGSGLQTAMHSVWEQLFGMIDEIATTMTDSTKKFKDSKIKNLRQFCKLLPTLNLTNDPNLERMRGEAEKRLAGLDPAELRTDKPKRKQAAKDAKALIAKMSQCMK